MGLLSLFPVTFHAYHLAKISKKGLEVAVLELHIKLAEKLAKQVDGYFKLTEDKIRFALAALSKDMAWADKQALLQSLIETHQDIIEISVLNGAGREMLKVYNPELSAGGELRSRAGEKGFSDFLKTRHRTMLVSPRSQTLELYYPMSALALTRFSVSLRSLASEVAAESVGGTGFAVLVDETGRPLFFLKERLPGDSALRVSGWPIVVAALKAKSVGSSEFRDPLGRDFVGAYAPVASLGGAIIILQPQAEAYLAASEMRRSSALVLVVVLVAALLVATQLARRLTSPLLALTRSAEAVARGDLQARVAVTTRDELQDLAETFNKMVQQLRGYSEIQVDRLVAEQRKTGAILFSIDEGIVLVDKELRIQLANRRAVELLGVGLSMGSLEDKPLGEALSDSPLREDLLHIMAGDGGEDLRRSPKDVSVPEGNSVKHIRVTARPVISPGTGAAMGTLMALRDVTLEKELDKLKESFLQNITHDLRNPLGSAMGFVEALLKNVADQLTPAQRVMVSSIHRSGNRLMGMINNILDIAKMQSGRLRLNIQSVCLAEVGRRSMANLAGLYEQKKIAVILDMPEDLRLDADGDLLERVFNNLLGNAIKFTPAEGKITLSAIDEGTVLRACVADTGDGVPAAYREKIFEKFEQVAGQQRKGGTGLGLTITKAFVEAHGGRIWVESEVKKGSRFYFTLAKDLGRDVAKSAAAATQAS